MNDSAAYCQTATECPECGAYAVWPTLQEEGAPGTYIQHHRCDACGHTYATEITITVYGSQPSDGWMVVNGIGAGH